METGDSVFPAQGAASTVALGTTGIGRRPLLLGWATGGEEKERSEEVTGADHVGLCGPWGGLSLLPGVRWNCRRVLSRKGA